MTDTVLIAGGNGFIGAHAVRAFLDVGWRVQVFGPRQESPFQLSRLGGDDRLEETEGSIEDAAALGRVFAAAKPRLAISFAAFSAGPVGLMRSGEAAADRALAVNVLGFRRFLETAHEAGIRRVLWSSSTVVYGPATDYGEAPVDEGASCRPRTFYGLTKLLAEDVARFYRSRHGIEVAGLRLPLVIGPGLWYQGAAAEITRLFAEARPGASFAGAGSTEPADLIYVEDVAAAFVAAACAGPLHDVYNITGFRASDLALVDAVRKAVPGFQATLEPRAPAVILPFVDGARFERDTGFRPRFDLTRTVAAFLAAVRGS